MSGAMLETHIPTLIAMLQPDERADVQERAAIMEFDGGMDREQAELMAWAEFCKHEKTRRRECTG